MFEWTGIGDVHLQFPDILIENFGKVVQTDLPMCEMVYFHDVSTGRGLFQEFLERNREVSGISTYKQVGHILRVFFNPTTKRDIP